MAEHDSGYRLIFSHPRMVADLLGGVPGASWLATADLESLRQVSGSQVSGDLRDRHADTVWRLRWLEASGEWTDGYVFLEFQATPYRFMAVRMTTYLGLLYEDLVRKRLLGRGRTLPPVLLVVLYNGRKRWGAPRSLSDLVAWPEGAPQVRYQLVDMRSGDLGVDRERSRLLDLLCRLEAFTVPGGLPEIVEELAALLPKTEEPELRRDLTAWIVAKLRRAFPGAPLPLTLDLEEIAMLEDNGKDWLKEAREDGMRQILLSQMERRFGPLPKKVQRKIRSIASTERLQQLAEQVLFAASRQEMGLG